MKSCYTLLLVDTALLHQLSGGRTAYQCLEHYEKLLDQAQARCCRLRRCDSDRQILNLRILSRRQGKDEMEADS